MADSEHRLNPSLNNINFKLSCAGVLDKLVSLDQALIDSIYLHTTTRKSHRWFFLMAANSFGT
jgi:hypothetical protein